MTISNCKEYVAGAPDAGRRLDVVVAGALGISRTRAAALIREGAVLARPPARLKPSTPVAVGDVFALPAVDDTPRSDSLVPEDLPLAVVYEDDSLLVVDKPAGMVVHPAAGHLRGTLANAIAARISIAGSGLDPVRPGIVHRLDRGTSGLIVVAKTFSAHQKLAAQIKSRSAGRTYLALTLGHWLAVEGTIDAPLGRSPSDRKKMTVTGSRSRPAVTHYRVTESYPAAELVQVRLETGRTHQIRVHFSHSGHPVLGDSLYGGGKSAISGVSTKYKLIVQRAIEACGRQALHACRLSFEHPVSGERLDFTSGLPQDFEKALAVLRGQPID